MQGGAKSYVIILLRLNSRFFNGIIKNKLDFTYNKLWVMATGEEDFNKIMTKIDYLVNLISSLTASQRQLTISAIDLQSLALAQKRQIKNTMDRAIALGEIQDIYIKELMIITEYYLKKKED